MTFYIMDFQLLCFSPYCADDVFPLAHPCLCLCVRTGSALSLLYGTSATMEHHHFNHAVMILQSEVLHVPIPAAMQLQWRFSRGIMHVLFLQHDQMDMLCCTTAGNKFFHLRLLIHYFFNQQEHSVSQTS